MFRVPLALFRPGSMPTLTTEFLVHRRLMPLVLAVGEAFRAAFLVTGALALLGLGLVLYAVSRERDKNKANNGG